MESTELTLLGAPDASLGKPEDKSNATQIMQIDLTQEVLDELIRNAENGKQPQILFGRAPQLRYGDKTALLDTHTERTRHELYLPGGNDTLSFAGLVSHTLAVQAAQETAAGVDTALEALKNNLASIQEGKDARKTVIDSTPIPQHRRNLSQRGNLLRPSSNPSSPAFGAASPHTGPTSAPTQEDAAKLKAIRLPLIHILAVGPRTSSELTKLLRCKTEEAKAVLDKIAKPSDGSKYTLSDRAFKELDVFAFPYKSDEERQGAIDNAIKAYDRQRVSKEEKLWQKLLPKEDRGKGKVLSKLNIVPPAQTPATGSKQTKKVEKKEPTTTKSESKKSTGEAATKKTTTKLSEKEPPKKSKAGVLETSTRKPETTRQKKAPKSAAIVPKEDREDEKAPVLKTATRQPKPTKRVVATPAKPLQNKPKNPSPLSASAPVNASDFEDDHPVHKALSASASPAKSSSLSSGSVANSDRSLKRKANDLDNNIHAHATSVPKQRKLEAERPKHTRTPVNGFKPGSRNTTPSTSSVKRKAAPLDTNTPSSTSGPTPTKRPRLSATMTQTNTQSSNASDSPEDASPTSPLTTYSYSETIQMSQRFHRYYEKYAMLHSQLSTSPEPPTNTQRAELLRMHDALQGMKDAIRIAVRNHEIRT